MSETKWCGINNVVKFSDVYNVPERIGFSPKVQRNSKFLKEKMTERDAEARLGHCATCFFWRHRWCGLFNCQTTDHDWCQKFAPDPRNYSDWDEYSMIP